MALRDIFRRPPKTDKALGRAGTVNLAGFISETELTNALRWPNSLDTYDLMRRTDPTVRWMLALVKTPIRAATWTVEPSGSDDAAREVAAFCEYGLTHIDGGLDDFLRRALTYLDFGHSVFEKVASFEACTFTYESEAGEDVEVTREGFVLAALAERLQRTILKWNPDPRDDSKLASIEQMLFDGTNVPPIPVQRLVVFTNEQEGDDWRGTSLLRSAYRSYDYKQKLENLEAIAYERSIDLPVVYCPENATDAQLDAIEEALKLLRQGESVYLMMPGPKAGTTKTEEGWLVDAVSLRGDADRSADSVISRHETAMARNVLAEFMRLGHEQVGARATADIQQDPYYQAVEAQVRYIEDVVTDEVIAPLVAWNYGDAAVPRFAASKITAKNIQVIADAAAALLDKGGIIADPETENALRELLDLPKRKPPPEGEVPAVPEPPGPAGGAPNGNPPPPTFAEFRPRRELRPEERPVAFAEIAKRLDQAQADFADVAAKALEPAIAEAESEAKAAVYSGDVGALDQITVDPGAAHVALTRELVSIYEEGRRQVRSELRAQRTFALPTNGVPQPPEWLDVAAGTAALNISQAAGRAITMRAIFEIEHPGVIVQGPGYDPRMAVNGEAKRAALGQVNLAFGNGRRDEQLARADTIEYSIYTALLDGNTCAECEQADGQRGPAGGDPAIPVPNPLCEGGAACRCMWIGVVGPASTPGPTRVPAIGIAA